LARASLPVERREDAFVTVGRYTVLAQIAAGGMGSVHVASMRGPAGFSRLVAIKCLHTRWLDDPKLVERFKSEIRLSAHVLHPNVVQTLDVVEVQGELFLVMDYVDGVTLAALISELNAADQRLPVAVAVSIVSSLLRGLHAAHETQDEHGRPLHIVHRDVSPQNVMISRSGHVKVLDFGVAKALGHSQHTAAGAAPGKLAYMSPEQVCGEQSSPRTDVFAAGVVLWEVLAGRRLFSRPGLAESELLWAVIHQPVPRVRQLRMDVPAAVDEVISKALERNPERRFQTALEFAAALEAAAASAMPATIAELVAQACKRRLEERDALLWRAREQEAAFAEAALDTEVQHENIVSRPTLPGVIVLGTRRVSRQRRHWPWLLGAAALSALGVWRIAEQSMRNEHAQSGWTRNGWAPAGAADTATHTAVQQARMQPDAVQPDAVQPDAVQPDAVQRVVLSARAGAASGSPKASASEVVAELEAAASSATAQTLAASVANAGRRAAPRRKAQPARRKSSNTSCDPPTYMDSQGIRHFKKSCL
jgi:eukaryotic-like serine/threonine-protein kinase